MDKISIHPTWKTGQPHPLAKSDSVGGSSAPLSPRSAKWTFPARRSVISVQPVDPPSPPVRSPRIEVLEVPELPRPGRNDELHASLLALTGGLDPVRAAALPHEALSRWIDGLIGLIKDRTVLTDVKTIGVIVNLVEALVAHPHFQRDCGWISVTPQCQGLRRSVVNLMQMLPVMVDQGSLYPEEREALTQLTRRLRL